MRPVAAPNLPIRICRDKRLCKRQGVGEVGPFVRSAVGAGNLHISTTRFDEIEQRAEAILVRPLCRLGAPEMVEYDGERQLLDMTLQRRDNARTGIKLDMPAVALDLFDRRVERAFRVVGIDFPARGRVEIETNAANSLGGHLIDLVARRVLVDDGDAARASTQGADGIERTGIVGPVDAGL